MGKMYEIDKLFVVLFQYTDYEVDGYYDYNVFVKQIMCVDNGIVVDIFKDKYIKGLYDDGEMPEFYYSPFNYISKSLFNKKEIERGLVSEEKLLEIYCALNPKFINYDNIINNENCPVIDLNNYRILSLKRRKKENK